MWFLSFLKLFAAGTTYADSPKQKGFFVLAMLAVLLGTMLLASGIVGVLDGEPVAHPPSVQPKTQADTSHDSYAERARAIIADNQLQSQRHVSASAILRTAGGAVGVLGGMALMLGVARNKVK